MERRVLDTSILIRHWRTCRIKGRGEITTAIVRIWARKLIALYDSNAIVTPVYIEMIAGVTSRKELRLTLAFLEQFRCIDERRIPEHDWNEAIRLAQRVPRPANPRQLGDCLIHAICKRLRYQVATHDTRFAR
jgi:predicted nucleic acid-binding protein